MGKAGEYGRNIHRNMTSLRISSAKVSSLMRAYRASSHAAVRNLNLKDFHQYG